MGLTEKLFGGTIASAVARGIEERLPAIRDEVAKQSIAEATSAEASQWAFEHLSSAQYAPGQYELPQAFQDQIIRDSYWQYEAHGLGYMIVARIISLIFEGGLQYTIAFDEGVPTDVQAMTRKRLDLFWYDENVDLQDRAAEFVLQALLAGEHGLRLDVDPDNGAVSLFDICREDVKDLGLAARDKRRLETVTLKGDMMNLKERPEEALQVVRKNAAGYLEGDCLYFRLDTRASKRRGSPVLQRVIDELKAEKKFRVLSSDRIIQRMAVFVSTTLKGSTLKQVAEYAAQQPKTIPSGTVWYQNDMVTRDFQSANMEAGDISVMDKLLITVILGSFGFPLSWFAFGDSSTKATSETQQGPAAEDSKRMKRGIFSVFEKLMYFVLDRAILAHTITPTPDAKITVKDVDGNGVQKRLRDCITITVAPVPLAKEKPEGKPLDATSAAMDVIGKDDARALDQGQKLLTPENEVALMNYALARDGVGLEVTVPEETPEKVKTEEDEA
jgi:hypothetical protein